MKPPLIKLRKGNAGFAVVLAAIAFVGAFAVACSGDDATVPQQSRDLVAGGAAGMPTAAPRMPVASEMLAGKTAGVRLGSPDQVVSASAAAVVAPTMVIRNGTASIEVDSLEIAMAAVQKLASTLGGYVGNTSLTSGEYAVRSAELEMKIPSARYDAAVGGLAPIGKVESQTSTAEDVGEEFFDVQARQNNSHKLEERLIALLATRTGKLEDVLAVERELARVREEIERYEGRLRYLKSHVATSTLVITVHEKRPVVGAYAGESIIANSFRRAWRNFVQFIAGMISALGVIIPVGIIGAIVFALVARWRRSVRKQTALNSKPDKVA